MAKTFNPFRTTGGTIELIRDANGNYTTKEVGFDKLSSLSLPDLGTQATTTTTQATKTASQITGQTTAAQTQSAFQAGEGGNNQPDTSGNMLQEAEKTSNMLSDTFAKTRQTMTSDDAYRGVTSPLDIKDPTSSVFGSAKETVSDAQKQGQGVNYSDAIMRGQVGTKFVDTPKLGDSLFGFQPKGIETARGRQPTEFTDAATRAAMTSDSAYRGSLESSATRAAKEADFASGSLGVRADLSATRAAKEAGFASGSFPGTTGVPDAIKSGQPAVPEKAKKTFSESVTTALKTIKTPGMMVIDAISGAITSPQAKEQNAFNKTYFNDRGDGRIAGNPATDVFAGMNRQSAFGNVSASAAGRIATREKTIEKKGYKPGDKFYDDTQNMKNQKADYDNAKNTKAEQTKTQKSQNPNLRSGAEGGGQSSGRVICTDLHRTGELSTKDWIRDTKFTFKTLSKTHVKGYLLWAEPTVKHIQKYPMYRKMWKHIAQHRANDIAWRLNEGKFDLLGRIYAGIGEPVCWMLGNFVSDKQLNKYNTSHWRRV